MVVGDSVWDLLAARRAGALGVGLLSGGYGGRSSNGRARTGSTPDPADLLDHLDEIGVRISQAGEGNHHSELDAAVSQGGDHHNPRNTRRRRTLHRRAVRCRSKQAKGFHGDRRPSARSG